MCTSQSPSVEAMTSWFTASSSTESTTGRAAGEDESRASWCSPSEGSLSVVTERFRGLLGLVVVLLRDVCGEASGLGRVGQDDLRSTPRLRLLVPSHT